ncbi:MAG: hypothetical protein JKX84_02495 [Flavobacteriales bacterium]|nr:hypothetical protein [Flavobacteriales bacterium]
MVAISSHNIDSYGSKAVTYEVVFSNPKTWTVYDNGQGRYVTTSPGYRGQASVDCSIRNLKTNNTETTGTLSRKTKKYSDKNSASANALNIIGAAVSNMTYGFFKLSGEIINVMDSNRRGDPTRIEINLGSDHSLANGFKFNVYSELGSRKRKIGYLVLQDVLGAYSSRCKVKDGHKEIGRLIENGDKIYVEGNYSF